MNVIYVRTSENQLPSKAYIRGTLLQNIAGRGFEQYVFSREGARKYLPRLISRVSFLKFSLCEHSRNRTVTTFWKFTLCIYTRDVSNLSEYINFALFD